MGQAMRGGSLGAWWRLRHARSGWGIWVALLVMASLAMACSRDKGDSGDAPAEEPTTPPGPATAPDVPDWVINARVAGLLIPSTATEQEIDAALQKLAAENVSVVQVDTRLSQYLTDAEFDAEVAFIGKLAVAARAKSLRTVIYIPSLEVITPASSTAPNTMAKDHPDWLQIGLDGTPNVFIGTKEHWVDPDAESAWMSPNTGYRDYFLARVAKLAASGTDGVWVDVPLYLDTGSAWADLNPSAVEAFRKWSIASGLMAEPGLEPPKQASDMDPNFRAWLRWRHENLADFVEDVRKAAHAVNPDFLVTIETYTMDYMDASFTGYDGAYRRSTRNFMRVWEVDGVSNTGGMQQASVEDFDNKIAMFKWARGVDGVNPSWGFCYGNEPLDQGLVVGAAAAVGIAPFEAKTPSMAGGVDTDFRTRWFAFLRDNSKALLETPRVARVGIWYSSASRDFDDVSLGAQYAMFLQTTPPSPDPNWWGVDPDDSLLRAGHVGGWRGAAHALNQLHVPWKVIAEPGDPARALEGVSLLWLPTVVSLSDESANAIRQFVARGGILLATGVIPGILDDWGNMRQQSALADVFGRTPTSPGPRTNAYGQGVAVLRHDLDSRDLFGSSTLGAETLGVVEQLIRIHVPDDVVVDAGAGVFVEVSQPAPERHHLYVVNYTGLKQPLVVAPRKLIVRYRAPEGFAVTAVETATPDPNGQVGSIPITEVAGQLYTFEVNVDQFSLLTLTLAPATAAAPTFTPPSYLTPQRQDAARTGMDFMLQKMRNRWAPAPYSYGIFTNLNDDGEDDEPGEIYAYGHHVTSEHMGLMLQVAACMGEKEAYAQTFQYVRDVMVSPKFHVLNWAIDKNTKRPMLGMDPEINNWVNANSILDDFRAARGLLAGGQVGMPEAVALGEHLLRGLYWTSVTDRKAGVPPLLPAYPGGVAGFSYDFAETDDASLAPRAEATGLGSLGLEPIPIDYQDLGTVAVAARFEPRWRGVLASGVDLLLASEIATARGLFYNGLQVDGTFTGDFENQGIEQGNHLKVIQELWTGLHLAEAAQATDVLDATRRAAARAAAERDLAFFKTFYAANHRVPEYLTFEGKDVPACTVTRVPGCLLLGEENRFEGEARIYALLARLALQLGDKPFASQVVEERILTDRVSATSDPRFGYIGLAASEEGDAEAWNTLEALLTLCLESGGA